MRFFNALFSLLIAFLNLSILRGSYLPENSNGQITHNASLTIPNPIPKGTFVIHTINDRDSVEYQEDWESGGSATGQCKDLAGPKNHFLGPCLITVNFESQEGFVLARCRPNGGQVASTDANMQVHLWFDDVIGIMKADMFVHSSHAWYGFGNETSDSPLHAENKTFIDPDSVILINCVNDKRTPITDF